MKIDCINFLILFFKKMWKECFVL